MAEAKLLACVVVEASEKVAEAKFLACAVVEASEKVAEANFLDYTCAVVEASEEVAEANCLEDIDASSAVVEGNLAARGEDLQASQEVVGARSTV
jgi:hypothetical protein